MINELIANTNCRACGLAIVIAVSTFVSVYLLTNQLFDNSDSHISTDLFAGANVIGSRASNSLQFVTIFTQHGNSAPYVTYDNYLYNVNDTRVWPNGPNQLTQIGKVQMYDLGVKVRFLYNGFLSQNFKKELKATSTTTDRTLMSAALFLAGLYPPQGYDLWDRKVLWQPIPVFPNDKDHSNSVFPAQSQACPRFHKAQKESLENFQEQYGSKTRAVLRLAQNLSGIDVFNHQLASGSPPLLDSMWMLWESIKHADNEGLVLPEWTKPLYPEPTRNLVAKMTRAYSGESVTAIRLFQGLLFQDMVRQMLIRRKGSVSEKRLFYHSGHDSTLYGLFRILDLDKEDFMLPNAGSALIYELHLDAETGQYYVQVCSRCCI
ncbi:lysosomal acid phosphatase-like isoform X2 [Homalodisca vitripennis]|uniref:lysosomal acid phosphatase-like isoform X2 n=1 Tax=Homalodisca vitripennis TaxID=197043 RepID=UPI001EEA33EB|nr:lysosomal acid phosphatase-like isoform X2 [Homalodisca vitripennis]